MGDGLFSQAAIKRDYKGLNMIHHQLSAIFKRMGRGLLVAVVIANALSIALPAQPAQATTWYVATSGNNANSCTSPGAPCRTINTTISRAGDGDVINIAAGTYVENVNLSKSLSLIGAGPGLTIIDGGGIGPVILITSDIAGTTANLSGLTMRNGEYGLGGGLHSESGIGVVTVSNSQIINNVAYTGGGGIFSQGNLVLNTVLVENNRNNGTQRGGGLFNLGSATLTSVSFIGNTANLGGGIGNSGALTLTASIINTNQADEGGGIYNAGAGAQFTSSNNTYLGNHATSAGGAIYNATQTVDSGSLITGSLAATSGGGIYNHSTGQLSLNGTALRNNQAVSTHGGGLYSDGNATLSGVIVRGNSADSGIGGGVYSAGSGTVTVLNAQISENRAVNGGGLYIVSGSGSLTLVNSQITNNESDLSGGGLYGNITANLTSVTVSNNRALSGKGGGIYSAGSNNRLALNYVTLENNQALSGDGGGLYNESIVSLSEAMVAHNRAANGGGLYNNSSGRLSIVESIGYLNSATQGGGINNRGALTLTQSTLYSNTTTLQGGSALYNASTANAQLVNMTFSYNAVLSSTTGAILNDSGILTVLNGTISHNTAPALVHAGGSTAIANTIIAASTGGLNCTGALTSNGYNLSSDSSCGFNATGDLNNTDPLLGPLVNNGGSTLTRQLLVGSPAIDNSNNANCPLADQRGVDRPQGATCDIGAYEVIGYTNSVTDTAASGTCITSTTIINSNYLIGTLHVGANITFAPRGELRVKLYSPRDNEIQLLGDTGGDGQNLDVLWDDDATAGPVGTEDHLDIGIPFFKNVRVPDQSLTPVFGEPLRGEWRLEVCNVSSVETNTATLNRWTLVMPSVENPKVYLPMVRR